jgi:hypothetical protein
MLFKAYWKLARAMHVHAIDRAIYKADHRADRLADH